MTKAKRTFLGAAATLMMAIALAIFGTQVSARSELEEFISTQQGCGDECPAGEDTCCTELPPICVPGPCVE